METKPDVNDHWAVAQTGLCSICNVPWPCKVTRDAAPEGSPYKRERIADGGRQ